MCYDRLTGGDKVQDERAYELIRALDQREFQSARKLGAAIGVSDRTIRTLLREVQGQLEENGACLETRHGSGYRLLVKDREKFHRFLSASGEEGKNRFQSSDGRVKYLLELLLSATGFVKLPDLEEQLFVSQNTLSGDLKKAERILRKYRLVLVRKPGYGIRVKGKELDFRNCIADVILKRKVEDEREEELRERMKWISGCVRHSLSEHEIHLSEVVFQNLALCVLVTVIRAESHLQVGTEELEMENISRSREYQAAAAIVERLNAKLFIPLQFSDVCCIALHLVGKRPGSPGNEENVVISTEIQAVADEMLQKVCRNTDMDFCGDLELRIALCRHLAPLKIRVRYGMNLENPLLGEIKHRYSYAFNIALLACTVPAKHFGGKLSDDEVGYIAILFELAIERNRFFLKKKNILLICGTGKNSAQLLRYKYQQEFGMYLNEIHTCDVGEVEDFDFFGAQIDYVFTTVPIETAVPVPIIQVGYFLENQDRRLVKQALLQSEAADSIVSYYPEELFIPELSAKDKTEALQKMCALIEEKRRVPEHFFQSVMKRESLARTEFGNFVAMPHPDEPMSEETFVCVAVLKEAVVWGDNQVKAVFLISVDTGSHSGLNGFYQTTARFLLNPSYINELYKTRSWETLIRLMKETEHARAEE